MAPAASGMKNKTITKIPSRFRKAFKWSALTFIMTLSTTLIPGITPASGAESPVSQTIPGPVFVQLKTNNFDIETIDRIYDMGFRGLRRGIYWDQVEKENGVYDFSAWDKEFAHARDKGMTIIGCFFGNNKIHEDDGRGGIQTEEGRKGFAAFAAAAVEHYKDYPILWEIWNEPNVRTFWRNDGMHNTEPFAEEYTALVKEVMKAVLQKHPDAFVMAGSVSNYWQPSYEWTGMCFQKGILDTGIKAWSVHPYGVKTPEEFAIGHKITRDLLAKYGKPDLIMLNTERGFALREHQGGGEVANEGWSGGSASDAQIYQAWHYVRQFMADQLAGVQLTTWYELGGDEGFALDPGSPVEKAAIVMSRELAGFKFVKRIPSDNPLDYAVLFENSEGARKLVAWTSPPAAASPDQTLDHPALLLGVSGNLQVVDIAGSASTISGDPAQVDLTGSPLYVTLPGGAEVTLLKALPGEGQKISDFPIFEENAAWEFIKNTGDGSFNMEKDGDENIGVLEYDFSQSTTANIPYVMASSGTPVEEGYRTILLSARSKAPQRLTFRLVDATGQNHQFKTSINGTGDWERVSIPLDRKLESWGGDSDGEKHFPTQSFVISVPRNSEDQQSGKIEFANATLQ